MLHSFDRDHGWGRNFLKRVVMEVVDDAASWEDFPTIPPFLLENLSNHGFPFPFPVQSAVIDAFFSSDSDLAIGFPTGSGKTLSYLIPIISFLHKRVVPRVRAIVVVPNRELATQVFNVASMLIDGSSLSIVVLQTGMTSGARQKGKPHDIVVTTAHALSSFIVEKEPSFLAHTEVIVLDEGDVILEQPLENWLEHVQRSLDSRAVEDKLTVPLMCHPPPNRPIRRILCSATLARNAKQSEDFRMVSPILLVASEKSRYVVPQGISEQFIVCEKEQKLGALLAISEKLKFVLCFVATNRRCLALSAAMKKLKPSLSVIEFAGTRAAGQRKKIMEDIVEGQTRLIIATDALARGIDIPFLDAVVNFDAPQKSRTYVHRMGRTARGGATGTCITLLYPPELTTFRDVISKIDGSAPIEASADIRRFCNDDYFEQARKLDKLKVRKVASKHRAVPEASGGEYDNEEEENIE